MTGRPLLRVAAPLAPGSFEVGVRVVIVSFDHPWAGNAGLLRPPTNVAVFDWFVVLDNGFTVGVHEQDISRAVAGHAGAW